MRTVGKEVVAVLCLLFLSATAVLAVSVGTGDVPGGWVRRVAASPTDAKTLYATSWNVYKSTDGGYSWFAKPYPLPTGTDQSQFARHLSYDIAVCPNNENCVIVGDQNETSVWRTDNGGDTWTAATLENDSERRMVTMVSFSLTDPNRCFAAGRINPNVGDVRDQILYTSSDKGASWSRAGLTVSNRQTIMDAVQVPFPDHSGRIFTAVADQYYPYVGDTALATSGKIYYSDDNGATFSAATAFTTTGWAPYKFAWDATHNKLWVIGSNGYIYSNDGTGWTQATQLATNGQGAGVGPIFFHKLYYKVCGGQPMMFATTNLSGIVYRSTGTFTTWTRATYPDEADNLNINHLETEGEIFDICVDTTDPSGATWGCATSVGGYYITTDTGAHLTAATGINTREVRYGARQGDRIFLNTFGGSIYGSTDSARTWTKVYKSMGGGSGLTYITLHPTDTAKVYLTDGQTIQVSTCNGLGTFSMISPILNGLPMGNSRQFVNLLIHPSTPTVMYLGVATTKGATRGTYLYKSENGGTTWTAVSGLSTRGVNLLAFDPKNPDVIYASGGSGWGSRPFNGDGDGLYKSTDSAQTWTKLGAGILDQGYLETIAFAADDTDIFWAGGVYSDPGNGTMDCVYVSTDGGKHFRTQLMNGQTINSSRIFFFDRFLYYGTSEGYLYKSDDKGQTWGVAMVFPAMLEWLIDDSSTTVSSSIRRASSSTGALYAGGQAGMYRVTGMGPASGFAGGYGVPAGSGGFGDVTDAGVYAGGAVKSYNYPNPFNPKKGGATTIKFSLPRAVSSVKAKLYSMSAQLVLDGDLGSLSGGNSYTFTWDGRNKNGELCGPGLYFLVIDADGTRAKHKIVLVY
jgi:photosystem II stability/assembly factor-like uncharacterized protein